MRKPLRLIIWYIFTFWVIYNAMHSDAAFVLDRDFMYEKLLNPRKLFLIINITFAVLLFIKKNLYQNPMVLTRAGDSLAFKIIKNGLLTSLAYTVLFFLSAVIITLASGAKIDISFLFDVFLLFFFTLYLYLLCYLIYSFCNKWSLANISVILIHIFLSGIAISFGFGKTVFSNSFFYIALSILCGGGLVFNVNNKDYL